jgi:hypothetical protein
MDTIDASMCRLQQCYAGTYFTSDQHKEATRARKERDRKDTLNTFSPFIISNVRVPIFSALSTLTSGSATTPVSIFRREASEVKGFLSQRYSREYLSKSNQAVTLAAKTKTKSDSDFPTTDIDPQLMFQHLTTAANGLFVLLFDADVLHL